MFPWRRYSTVSPQIPHLVAEDPSDANGPLMLLDFAYFFDSATPMADDQNQWRTQDFILGV